MADGAAAATKFKINSAIGLNEFFSDRSGTEELVSVKRNEGGFIEVVNALNEDEKANSAANDMGEFSPCTILYEQ